MNRYTLILRYAAFAAIATIANLFVQRLVLYHGNAPAYFAWAVLLGTIVGLGIKYLLDKNWIFYDTVVDANRSTKQFFLYSTMGVVTTVIFWGLETAFWLVWKTEVMREVGAILGLLIGYIVKYNLDKRFVFAKMSRVSTP